MIDNAEYPDAPPLVQAPATPASEPAPDSPPPPTSRRSGAFFLGAVGAAVVGALLTMAFLGGKPATQQTQAAASPVAAPVSARPQPPVILPRWNQAHEGRWISNHRRSIAYEIDATRPVPVWMRHVRPTLVVRCLANTTDVFVFTDSAARIEPRDDNHTVRIGFDDEPVATERWPDSADHDALFAPNGLLMAQRLTRARSMRFAFTPHNADPVMVEFNVAGFDAIAGGMAKTCGWK